jgi:MoxR-like ATPase
MTSTNNMTTTAPDGSKRAMTPEQIARKKETDRRWREAHRNGGTVSSAPVPKTDAPRLAGANFDGAPSVADVQQLDPLQAVKPATVSGTSIDALTNGIQHLHSDWKSLIPHGLETYIEQGSEKSDVRAMLTGGNAVLLLGDKGVGKSLLARKIAEEDKVPVFTFNGSMGVTEEDMLGYFANLGQFIDGIVTQAVKCAQEFGAAMLIMEEINSIPAGVTMCLHPLLDFVKSLIIRTTGEVLNMNGSAGHLYIIGTANIGTEGTQAMNTAFKSRFGAKLYVEFPKDSVFKTILERDCNEVEIVDAIVSIVKGLRNAYKNSELSDAPSIREAVNLVRVYKLFTKQYGKEDAFTKACDYVLLEELKFNRANYDVAKNIVKSCGGRLYKM